MKERLERRLVALQREFEIGEERLRALEGESARLRETLLRISGAIQVLEELQSEATDSEDGHSVTTAAGSAE